MMRLLKILCVLGVLMPWLSGCAGAQYSFSGGRGQSGTREILVADESGRPVNGATITAQWTGEDIKPKREILGYSDTRGLVTLPVRGGSVYLVTRDGYAQAAFLGAALEKPAANAPDYFVKDGRFTVVLRAKPAAR